MENLKAVIKIALFVELRLTEFSKEPTERRRKKKGRKPLRAASVKTFHHIELNRLKCLTS